MANRRGEKGGRQEMKKGEQKQPQHVLKKVEEEAQTHVCKPKLGGGDGPDRFTLQHRQNLRVREREKKGALSRNPI